MSFHPVHKPVSQFVRYSHKPVCQFVFPSWSSFSMCFSLMFTSLSVSLPFHPLPEPVCHLVISSSSRTCLSACLFILFWNLSVSMPFIPFHPLPEPVHQDAFSSSSRTCLSACLLILFPNLSVCLPFHPFPEPVCQLAFTSSTRACLFPLIYWFTRLSECLSTCQNVFFYSFQAKEKSSMQN